MAVQSPSRQRRWPRRAAAGWIVALVLAAGLIVEHAVLRDSPAPDPSKGSGVAATQTRALPAFSSIDLAGSNRVTIHAGARQSVVVRGDDNLLARVTTDVRGGRLAI